MVKSIGNLKDFVERTLEGIKMKITPITKVSKLIADVFCKSKYVQLKFNI